MTTKEILFKDLFCAYFKPRTGGITVRGFAQMAGCSASHVSDCRTGDSGPDQEEAEMWADLLGVEDRETWLRAAAVARARATSTGRSGSAVYEERIAALEREAAKRDKQIAQLLVLARKAGIKIPDSCGD